MGKIRQTYPLEFKLRAIDLYVNSIGVIFMKIIIPLDYKDTKTYTWQKKWVSCYESPWGIFQKFQYANSATDKDLFFLFGTEKEKRAKIRSQRSLDLVYLGGFDREDLYKVIGNDVFNWNKENLKKIVKHLPKFDQSKKKEIEFIRNKLSFCPECILMGYHSIFHQIMLLSLCPFHLIPLIHCCPQCKTQIPYELNDKYVKQPFQCNCGYSFADILYLSEFYSKWCLSMELKDNDLITWLSLAQQEYNPFEKIHFNHKIKVEDNSIIKYLLSSINKNNPDDDHFIVSPAWYLHKLNSEHEQGRGYYKEFLQNVAYTDTIYNSSKKIYSSIARKLRNTLLKKHKTCINRFIKRTVEDEVCPYAYAYIMWRKNIEHLDHYLDFRTYNVFIEVM